MGAGKLPIGRATAQPRVNMSSVYSPYSSVRVTPHADDFGSVSHEEETNLSNKYEHPDDGEELKPLRVHLENNQLNSLCLASSFNR